MTNGNGTGVDLTGPLAGMWRDVYRKAAQVAEGRTAEHLKSHVYVYHPNGAGGGGGGGEEGPFVDEVGDTMTGTLHFQGTDVDAGGAVRVLGTAPARTDLQVYGEGSPAFTPGVVALWPNELGVRFRSAQAGAVVAVRWYRVTAAQQRPLEVRLFDSTVAQALLVLTTLPAFDDTAVGWKQQALAPGTELALVAGREYAVSYSTVQGTHITQALDYTPVADAPLLFLGNGFSNIGMYPSLGTTNAYGIDAVVGVPSGAAVPAHSGAIRLPNGNAGVIAWRDASDTADHTLTVDAAGELVYDGVPLGSGGGGGTGNTTMHTQTATPTGATNSLWFNPSETA